MQIGEAPDGMKIVGQDLKSTAQARQLDSHEFFNYSLPQSDQNGKPPKKKSTEGFTQKHFLELEKNSTP